MPSIVSYQKHIDSLRTVELRLPEDADTHQRIGTELATINGVTYVSLPDDAALPAAQPAEIAASVSTAALDQATREAIKLASPHCQLINDRMIEKIRAMYSTDDEMYFSRIGVGAATGLYTPTTDEMQAMTVFGEFVESVRQWGRDERAKLGL